MKSVIKFLVGLLLFMIAFALFLPLTILNFLVVVWKYRDLNYFKSSAISLDRFGNYEFRTLFNLTLIKPKRIKEGVVLRAYQFGKFEETISSVLGKNQRQGTLSKTGKILVWILDKIEKDHCRKNIIEI